MVSDTWKGNDYQAVWWDEAAKFRDTRTAKIKCSHGVSGEARRLPTTRDEVRTFAEWWNEEEVEVVHVLSGIRVWDEFAWFAEAGECCGGWYSEEDFAAKYSVVDSALQESI